MKHALDRVARSAISAVRSRSHVRVNLPPAEGIGLGNMMNFWLWAHVHRMRGDDARVLCTPAMDTWRLDFPEMDELLMSPSAFRLWHGRETHWSQGYSLYSDAEWASFVRERLLTNSSLSREAGDLPRHELVLNIRRGDYYSNPFWRERYAFDLQAFLKVAVDAALAQAPVSQIRVVSDDPQWVADELDWLRSIAPVTIVGPPTPVITQLAMLASAPRLILTNSSFSYWGGYISSTRFVDQQESVIAPWFHRRDIDDGWAWQVDPRWTIIRDIPGGW